MFWILKNLFALFLFCLALTCAIITGFNYFSPSEIILQNQEYIIRFDSFIAWFSLSLVTICFLLIYTWGRIVYIPSSILKSVKFGFERIKLKFSR